MERRNFIKTIALGAAGLVAGVVTLPKAVEAITKESPWPKWQAVTSKTDNFVLTRVELNKAFERHRAAFYPKLSPPVWHWDEDTGDLVAVVRGYHPGKDDILVCPVAVPEPEATFCSADELAEIKEAVVHSARMVLMDAGCLYTG